MAYYLGIDGGGTKTACMLVDAHGSIVSKKVGPSISHRQFSIEHVVNTIRDIALQCCNDASIDLQSLDGVCIGQPAFGEFPEQDKLIFEEVIQLFNRVHITNDVEVGWAGALACEPGINVVAGTGSIIYGRDESGKSLRSGGWSKTFSDEGSGYWLGMRGMALFAKQSDGRAPKGPLYDIVRGHYSLKEDFDFLTIADSEILPYPDQVAAFQRLLAKAGKDGDTTAQPLYIEAARELSDGAKAVRKGLDFIQSPVSVSYTGGVFGVGDLILKPLKEFIHDAGMELVAPLFDPTEGAVLLAANEFNTDHFNQICDAWESQSTK